MASEPWVATAERLPPIEVEVLCYIERRGVHDGWEVLLVNELGDWCGWRGTVEVRNVVYWMPIPPIEAPALALDAVATMRKDPQP
ncbi:MAG: hypothetical protein IT370_27985 [Deltaproteobacteria bacterium]|nr:hypothetical protein [Deltaproteobacteria bacterium]